MFCVFDNIRDCSIIWSSHILNHAPWVFWVAFVIGQLYDLQVIVPDFLKIWKSFLRCIIGLISDRLFLNNESLLQTSLMRHNRFLNANIRVFPTKLNFTGIYWNIQFSGTNKLLLALILWALLEGGTLELSIVIFCGSILGVSFWTMSLFLMFFFKMTFCFWLSFVDSFACFLDIDSEFLFSILFFKLISLFPSLC